jgi:hypothetical protein
MRAFSTLLMAIKRQIQLTFDTDQFLWRIFMVFVTSINHLCTTISTHGAVSALNQFKNNKHSSPSFCKEPGLVHGVRSRVNRPSAIMIQKSRKMFQQIVAQSRRPPPRKAFLYSDELIYAYFI